MKKTLERSALLIVLIGVVSIGYNYYNDYEFKHNPLNKELSERVEEKISTVRSKAKAEFGIDYPFQYTFSKLPSNLYGVTIRDKNGTIHIELNKSRFKESADYMIEEVVPHEYAHAIVFKYSKAELRGDGHTDQWQEICIRLGGKLCERYVDGDEVISGKMPGWRYISKE